jgi:NADPH-dependent glutamate synthase beta subunit-like oxidoreductase
MAGVVSGTALLRDVNLGNSQKIGKKVAVIGGGNVALDAARSAKRLGANDVTVVYRRSRDEMPAFKEEVEAAEKENIKIEFLATPSKVISESGKVTGLGCLRTRLGDPDESGRRRPEVVAGSEFALEIDMVVSAIGEIPDLSFLGNNFEMATGATLKVHPNSFSTNVSGVFAGGDAVSGPATVIEAVAAGRKAAIAIDRYLCGQPIDEEELAPRAIGIEDVEVTRFNRRERQEMPELSASERAKGFGEVELGYSERTALFEADRCLQCGLFPDKKKNEG